jgi:hypothetical protein
MTQINAHPKLYRLWVRHSFWMDRAVISSPVGSTKRNWRWRCLCHTELWLRQAGELPRSWEMKFKKQTRQRLGPHLTSLLTATTTHLESGLLSLELITPTAWFKSISFATSSPKLWWALHVSRNCPRLCSPSTLSVYNGSRFKRPSISATCSRAYSQCKRGGKNNFYLTHASTRTLLFILLTNRFRI